MLTEACAKAIIHRDNVETSIGTEEIFAEVDLDNLPVDTLDSELSNYRCVSRVYPFAVLVPAAYFSTLDIHML